MGSSCELWEERLTLPSQHQPGGLCLLEDLTRSSGWAGVNFLTLFPWCSDQGHAMLLGTPGTICKYFALVSYFGRGCEKRQKTMARGINGLKKLGL